MEPAQRPAWASMAYGHRNIRGLPVEFVGVHGGASFRVGKRANPFSPGREMQVYSSGSGNRVALPPPTPWSDTVKKHESAGRGEKVNGGETTSRYSSVGALSHTASVYYFRAVVTSATTPDSGGGDAWVCDGRPLARLVSLPFCVVGGGETKG